jgi:hypothetical protein
MTRTCLLTLAATLLCPVLAVAQPPDSGVPRPAAVPAVPVVPGVSGIYSPSGPQVGNTWLNLQRGVAENDEMRKVLNAIKDAESNTDKQESITKLRGLLEEQYDDSLDAYGRHLDEMEKKIAELREQLQRRRDARAEMVDLRVKMLVSEAEGLGWPDERPAAYFSIPGIVPPGNPLQQGGGLGAGAGRSFRGTAPRADRRPPRNR